MEAIRVHLPEDLRMNDDEFVRFCRENPNLKFERRKNGDIVFVANTGGESGNKNFEISADFAIWNRKARLFYFFDSSTAFRLPDTSIMSPDVAGIVPSRWESLTPRQRVEYVPLCPDFVLELRSATDRLKDANEKMADWMANGCRLGWLIDPVNQTTYVYRPAQEPEIIVGLGVLSGETVLPGFELDLALLG
ncbi:MAG: Uma2 family endonuclease [Bacteroidetes bacterium]|nr:Uma2 family endonuclease [Fibrella sp.]